MKQNVLQLTIHLRGQNGRPTQPHLGIGPPQGVICSSRVLSSAYPRHEGVLTSVTSTSNQSMINERRLSAPLSWSAFQSQLANNGSYSHQQ
uniref:Uncharacterized protein n=1 Tax=Amphimedon queenslandica TaxID=400682 RepID=A0A1X7SPF3_AMPQE